MLIDCTTCIARHVACRDCIVTVLLARPAPTLDAGPDDWPVPVPVSGGGPDPCSIDLDQDERDAIDTLAGAGLVPPLRLARAMPDLSGNIRSSA